MWDAVLGKRRLIYTAGRGDKYLYAACRKRRRKLDDMCFGAADVHAHRDHQNFHARSPFRIFLRLL